MPAWYPAGRLLLRFLTKGEALAYKKWGIKTIYIDDEKVRKSRKAAEREPAEKGYRRNKLRLYPLRSKLRLQLSAGFKLLLSGNLPPDKSTGGLLLQHVTNFSLRPQGYRSCGF